MDEEARGMLESIRKDVASVRADMATKADMARGFESVEADMFTKEDAAQLRKDIRKDVREDLREVRDYLDRKIDRKPEISGGE